MHIHEIKRLNLFPPKSLVGEKLEMQFIGIFGKFEEKLGKFQEISPAYHVVRRNPVFENCDSAEIAFFCIKVYSEGP